jgi:hypothetical protein
MPNFTIETPNGKRLTIEAPDEATAIRGAQEWYAQQQKPVVQSVADPMGSDGVSGDMLRANAAGDTRAKMPLDAISGAYDAARQRGDRSEQEAMARAYVQRERQDSPIMTGVGDRVRSVARGVPFIGEYLDEANAKTAQLFGNDYQKALDYERARDQSFDKANPIQSMAGRVTGGIAGTVAASPAAAAVRGGSLLLGLGAKTVPGAIGRGAVAGGLQGAAAGYGREGTTEAAVKDAFFGTAFGGVIPAALAVGRAGITAAANKFTPPDALQNVPAKARNFFMGQFGDEAAVAAAQKKMAELGPNAVLADVSPEMQMIARGAASRPGSREAIVNTLLARDQGKNARITTAIDDTLGKVKEPSQIERTLTEGMDSLGPRYGDVFAKNAQSVNTQPIAETLDALAIDLRGPAQKAVREVRGMLNIFGTNQLDPSPNTLFQTRQAVDGLLATETNPKAIRELTMARQNIDSLLASRVPGVKQVDAQFQELAQQKGALEDGARIFRTGPEATRPADLAERLAGASQPKALNVGPSAEQFRLSQGARAEIDRIVGSNSNDVAALRNFLKGEGDWNRQKLASVFGSDKAERILKVLDNETAMENTYRTVVGGSQTAPTQGFKEFIDEAAKGTPVPADTTMTGLALRGARGLLERFTGSSNEAKAARFAEDLGRLSVAGGKEADDIIKAILRRQGIAKNDKAFADWAARAGAGTARADDPISIKAAIAAAILGRDAARDQATKRPQ